jgi:hypothetical protein
MREKNNDLFIYSIMQKIYDIIIAVNRLRERIVDLTSKIYNLSASPLQQLNKKYLNEATAVFPSMSPI